MSKSADAFRTISEVADWLEVPAHVLRFWESKFTQVKPVKRAGGRRYYRPADMRLLGGIRKLLHDEGMTIKGVQKVMREQGVRHVAAMSPPLDPELEEVVAGIALDVPEDDTTEAAAPRGEVVSFDRTQTATPPEPAEVVAAPAEDAPESVGSGPPETADEPPQVDPRDDDTPQVAEAAPDAEPAEAPHEDAEVAEAAPTSTHEQGDSPQQEEEQPEVTAEAEPAAPAEAEVTSEAPTQPSAKPAEPKPAAPPLAREAQPIDPEDTSMDEAASPSSPAKTSLATGHDAPEATPEAAQQTPEPESEQPPANRVTPVETPDDPADDAPAPPSAFSGLLAKPRTPSPEQREQLADIASRLAALRARGAGQAGHR